MKLEQDIIIYTSRRGKTQLEVNIQEETVWLTQKQIAELFGTKRPAITKHFSNLFKTRELKKKSVCSILEHTAADGKTYKTQYYNLDAIISVGYRVNSKRATQFRMWATDILKKHLINGYTLNEKRLKQYKEKLRSLEKTINIINAVIEKKELSRDEATSLLKLLSDYNYALDILDDYDNKTLKIRHITRKETFRINYDESMKVIEQMKKKFKASGLFGAEKDKSFRSSVDTIYQSFDGKDLYPSVEEKAANLLYLVVKNHSFVDGNKRIAAAIFIWFLERNGVLYRKDGKKRIEDNALVAITLMIAESRSAEHKDMVSLVVSLINKNN
ncbi:MAG: virulence RhuM family protein [Candidatus Omnitrophica bacterium]|nr:virulence RhuM family protein [Candidatus Omnitrophota bacterium]MBU1127800.1 virulence RhuM family protein [Candidatus Omnitrophota bacterium]MBU1851320.1 virulence RhuM family protein [Candidatus Omnitrophota bacterium]